MQVPMRPPRTYLQKHARNSNTAKVLVQLIETKKLIFFEIKPHSVIPKDGTCIFHMNYIHHVQIQ